MVLYCPNLLEWVDISVVFDQHLPYWPQTKTSARVRDLWQHEDLGVFERSFTGTWIAPHSVMFLKVTPV